MLEFLNQKIFTKNQSDELGLNEPKVACTPAGNLIIASGAEIKLVSPEADMSLFSNYPISAFDKVYLKLSASELVKIVQNVTLVSLTDWRYLNPLYSQIQKSFDGSRARVSYIDALFGV
jgi:hypothetical protein